MKSMIILAGLLMWPASSWSDYGSPSCKSVLDNNYDPVTRTYAPYRMGTKIIKVGSAGLNAFVQQFDDWMMPKWCNQGTIDALWSAFDLASTWDSWLGYGWESACDTRMPMARYLGALYTMEYFSDVAIKRACTSCKDSILYSSLGLASKWVRRPNPDCASGLVYAGTYGVTPNSFVTYHRRFHYDAHLVQRTAIVIHEALHASGKGHAANTCLAGTSCDLNWGYNGSNTYEALWLWWVYHAGVTLRASAMPMIELDGAGYEAQWIIDRKFVTPPNFQVLQQ
jgi:hypothetical protein